jgi:predicted dehydrogenase
MAEISIGLVGCGLHADAHVGGLLAVADRIRVTAVCDIDRARAEERAVQLGTGNVFVDYDALLARTDVDAVLLCLPHLVHAPAAIAAAAAGKHVLVEKPIATRLEDADAMIAAARAAGVTLMVGHNQRFMPEHQRIRELLDEGAIGQIESARADHQQEFQPPAGHWIRNREVAGGGAFIGYGVHRVDLLRWYAGEVAEVAHFQRFTPERFGGESASVTILKFADGALGEMSINWVARNSPLIDRLQLVGEKGSIHNRDGLHLESTNLGPGRIDVPEGDRFALQLEHFADSVINRKPPLTSGEDARRTLEVCLAGYRSAETSQVVRLPLTD